MNPEPTSISDRHLALLGHTTSIVTAILATPGLHDPLKLMGDVHAKLVGLIDGVAPAPASAEAAVEKPTPTAIRKSITPDGIVSFIDGRTYQTLRRHLTKHGHNPESYRATYGLPADYPTTAPAYSEKRSALAKKLGLGVPGGRALREAA